MKTLLFALLFLTSFSSQAATLDANIETIQFKCKMYGDGDIKHDKNDILEKLYKNFGENIIVFGINPEENNKWKEVCTYRTVDGKSFITGHSAVVYIVNIEQ